MEEPNFKGLLQIHCQKAKVKLPQYSCTQRMKGNSPVFLANLTVLGRNFISEAEFSSKKQAEKSVAKVALRELGIFGSGKLKPADDRAHEQTVDGGPTGHEADQSYAEASSVLTLAAEESQESNTAAPEVGEKVSTRDLHISSPEVPRALLPPNTQTTAPTTSNSPVSFKNVLQERAQKMGLALPQYETVQEGSGFVCTVTFNGQCFKSEGVSPSKKLAQQNAASVAIKLLTSEEQGACGNSPLLENKTPSKSLCRCPTATPVMSEVSYKNLLQENCQQRGNKPPAYSTTWEGKCTLLSCYPGLKLCPIS